VTTPLSKTTSFGYDRGDLVSVETPLGHVSTRYTDGVGRVVRQADGLGAVTTFEYNALNQVTKRIDPRGGETTFTYDSNGNLLTLTDARGKVTTWTYNNMDRIAMNRTGFIGGPIPREDGSDAPTQQVLPRAA
jgi:YD repeat-containing protein